MNQEDEDEDEDEADEEEGRRNVSLTFFSVSLFHSSFTLESRVVQILCVTP